MDQVIADVANRIADNARSAAPVLTGEYRDSIVVEKVAGGYDIVADAEYSMDVEARHGTMQSAANSVRVD